jgi:hypothetical protein
LHVNEFGGSWWISDDTEALRYARFQHITTRETIDIVRIAVVNGDVSTSSGFNLMHEMADHDRHLTLPKSVEDLLR